MRSIHLVSCAVVSLLLLALVGRPGETMTRMGDSSYPWRPAGWGTPSIDVVGRASFAAEVYGDVAVSSWWGLRGEGLLGERITDGSTAWRYENGWTGTTRWSHPSASSASCRTGDPVLGSVRSAGETVLVFQDCAGAEANVALGADRLASVDDGGALVVRGVQDGKVLWRVPSAGLRDNPYGEAMGVSDELVTVRSRTEVAAYRIADGRTAWRRALSGEGDGTVLTDGVDTYVAEDATTLVKLDARTGRVVDRHRFEADITPRWTRDGLAGIGVGTGDDAVVG
ncbi:PQQ-binding-like beta-propeller repeat protein [Nonomuraea sp. NPDC050783]|uniref:outer membrane protein assembly factor BamB family protein n=1 Tax=Nonomuraea sp. NPDC050783 TaxID=3154634 RepID=UPI0034663656